MSMHKIPLTDIERTGLVKHGLTVDKPSQLSDGFRQGVAHGLLHTATHITELVANLQTQRCEYLALEMKLAEAQKDSARYRWLRNDSSSSYIGIYRDPHSNCRRYLFSTEADTFIDAAMQPKEQL